MCSNCSGDYEDNANDLTKDANDIPYGHMSVQELAELSLVAGRALTEREAEEFRRRLLSDAAVADKLQNRSGK